MKKDSAHLIKASVKSAYNSIAQSFSQTRQRPWEDFNFFLPYLHSGDRVLDLGCGNGRLYSFLKEKLETVHYLGVDQSRGLLDLAQSQHPEAEFLEQDMEKLKVEEEAFDALLCIAAFHHLPSSLSRERALQNMHRALKKEGILILTVWNLFQSRYWSQWLRAMGSWILHFGQRLSWNDLWIQWGKEPQKRYYHAFLPQELKAYFSPQKWTLEAFYFSRKGKKVGFWKSFNFILVARKR